MGVKTATFSVRATDRQSVDWKRAADLDGFFFDRRVARTGGRLLPEGSRTGREADPFDVAQGPVFGGAGSRRDNVERSPL